MKILQQIEPYKSFYFKASLIPRSPASGFSFAIGSTGESQVFNTGIVFSGKNGFIFDQSGNFFGGYHSGRQLEIEGHLFNNRLSYFYNNTLISNNIAIVNDFQDTENVYNCIEFDKINDSSLFLDINYISGYIQTSQGLQDINGIFLISSDNYYILPKI